MKHPREKVASQRSTHQKGWKENYLSSSIVSGDLDGTRFATPLALEPADRILGKLAEDGKQ